MATHEHRRGPVRMLNPQGRFHTVPAMNVRLLKIPQEIFVWETRGPVGTPECDSDDG